MALAESQVAEKKYADAITTLTALSNAMGKSPVGAKADARLSELKDMPEARQAMKAVEASAKAASEYSTAAKLKDDGKNDEAYSHFKQIVKQFPDTDSAKLASAEVSQYEKDPAFVKRANESAAGGKAKGMISLAQSYVQGGSQGQGD